MVICDKAAFNMQWTVNMDTKVHAMVSIKRALRKNVTDTCVIDIKTKADKEEEGWEQWLQQKAKEVKPVCSGWKLK